MKKFCVSVLLGAALTSFAAAQGKSTLEGEESRSATRAAREEIRQQKMTFLGPAQRADVGPLDYADTDSFGKDVKFLGSLYAGTVFFDTTCDPSSVGTLAPDDKCVVKPVNANQAPQTFTDSAWQITIPGKSAKNVIYLLLNNSVQEFATNTGPSPGLAGINYSPQVELVSTALNDPAAINPTTGMPMAGSFLVGLPGSKINSYILPVGEFRDDILSYGSVNGRGFSRAYFRALGLPESVITNLFNKDLTLKFSIRAGARPKTEAA